MTTQFKTKQDISFFEENNNSHIKPSPIKFKTSEFMSIYKLDRIGIVFLIIFLSIVSFNTMINFDKGLIKALLSTPIFASFSVSLFGAFFSNLIFSLIFKGNKKLTLIGKTRNEIQCITNIQDFRLKIKKTIDFINKETFTYKKNYDRINSLNISNSVPKNDIEIVLANNISLIEDIYVFAESLLNPELNFEALSALSESKILELRQNIILIVNENYFNRDLLGSQMRKIISATHVPL